MNMMPLVLAVKAFVWHVTQLSWRDVDDPEGQKAGA
jgi:hypothetical protein